MPKRSFAMMFTEEFKLEHAILQYFNNNFHLQQFIESVKEFVRQTDPLENDPSNPQPLDYSKKNVFYTKATYFAAAMYSIFEQAGYRMDSIATYLDIMPAKIAECLPNASKKQVSEPASLNFLIALFAATANKQMENCVVPNTPENYARIRALIGQAYLYHPSYRCIMTDSADSAPDL